MPFSPVSTLEKPSVVLSPESFPKAPSVQGEVYWPQLDGLRSVAFLLVFMHHLGPLTANNLPTLPLHIWTMNSICSWGGSGVDLFFSLSGFLITFLLLSEKRECGDISFKLFFARRALRIWPLYYFLLFVACALVPALQWSHLNQKLYGEFCLKQVLPMVLFLGNYSMIFATKVLVNFNANLGQHIIYFLLPLWSLAVEEQFYLTWPFILKALKRPKTILASIAALALLSVVCRWALWYISRHIWHTPFPVSLYYQTTLSHLDPLMAGAGVAAVAFYYPQILAGAKKYAPHMMLVLSGLVALVFCYFPDLKYNSYYNVAVFAVIALACLLTLTITLVSPTWKKVFAWGPLAYFGRLTYAMYLVHYFAIATGDTLIAHMPASLVSHPGWGLRFCVSLSLTFVFALLSWHLLESKCLKLRKHFRRHEPVAV